jgi:hypothetical protein
MLKDLLLVLATLAGANALAMPPSKWTSLHTPNEGWDPTTRGTSYGEASKGYEGDPTWRWFRRVAENNDGECSALMGKYYREGGGHPKNLQAARQWFKTGATGAGNAAEPDEYGQFLYGMSLIKGEGGARDMAAGSAFLSEAVYNGDPTAIDKLANLDWP